jgi:hypothetical protein
MLEEKLHHLLRLPILHIFCKLLTPWKKCSIALCLVWVQPSLVSPMAGFISSCIYLITICNTLVLSHSTKDVILPKSRQWQDSNWERERATRLTSTTRPTAPIDMQTLTGLMFPYLSDLLSHHCDGSKKNCSHSFFLSKGLGFGAQSQISLKNRKLTQMQSLASIPSWPKLLNIGSSSRQVEFFFF